MSKDTVLIDEFTNNQENIQQGEVITSESRSCADFESKLPANGQKTYDSDSEYESIGETIDATDNVDDSEPLPAVEERKQSFEISEVGNNQKEIMSVNESDCSPMQTMENKTDKKLSNFVLNLNTRNRYMKSPSVNSVSSMESYASSSVYKSCKQNRQKQNFTSNNKTNNENALEIGNDEEHVKCIGGLKGASSMPTPKHPLRHSSRSPAAGSLSPAKREAWVTKPSIPAERELTDQKMIMTKVISPQNRSTPKHLNKHINKIKDLKIQLNRLSSQTLQQYYCNDSTYASSQSSQCSSRRSNGKIKSNKASSSKVRQRKVASPRSFHSTTTSQTDFRKGPSNNVECNNMTIKRRRLSISSEKPHFEEQLNSQNVCKLTQQNKKCKVPSLKRHNSFISSLSSSSDDEVGVSPVKKGI